MVTFVDVIDNGFQGEEYLDSYETYFNNRLIAHGDYLQACLSHKPSDCYSNGTTAIFLDSYKEVQLLNVCEQEPVQMNFLGQNLTLNGTVPVTSTLLAGAIESIASFGAISVTYSQSSNSGYGCTGASSSFQVTFYTYMGDVPLIRLSPGSSHEIVKGDAQFVNGVGDYSVVIKRTYFSPGATIYLRVSAANSVGTSDYVYSYQNPIVFYSGAPVRPAGVSAVSVADTQLLVSWAVPPGEEGIRNFTHYDIEYDTNPAFSSWCSAPICSELNVRPQGKLVPSGLNNTHHAYKITHLIPGQAYFVRIRACYTTVLSGQRDVLCSPFTYVGYPDTPVAVAPARVPGAANSATATLLNSTTVAIDWTTPLVQPLGANGAAVSTYNITVSSAVSEVQLLTLTDITGNWSTEYAVSFGSSAPTLSRCISLSATVQEMIVKLEELPTIDEVEISLLTAASTSITRVYQIQFTGNNQPNGKLFHVQYPSVCNISPYHSAPVYSNVTVVGRSPFVPEVFELVTTSSQASTLVSGFFEIRFGYKGEMNRLANLVDGSNLITGSSVAGQRSMTTSSSVSHLLAPGVIIRINDQEVVVESVTATSLTFFPFLTHLSSSARIFVSETLLGTATVGNSYTILTTNNYLIANEVFVGDSILLTYTVPGTHSVSSSLVVTILAVSIRATQIVFTVPDLRMRFSKLQTVAMYRQKNAIIPYDASTAEMKAAFEGIPSVGSVDVSRVGPNGLNGLTWSVSFTSAYGSTQSCSTPSNPTASCLSVYSMSSSVPLRVTVAPLVAMKGTYFSQAFVGGRRAYFQFNGPYSIAYNIALARWQLFDGSSASPVLVRSSTSMVPVLTGVTLSLGSSLTSVQRSLLCTGSTKCSVAVSNIQKPIIPSLTNIVKSVVVSGAKPEVQSVTITASDGLLFGGYNLDFNQSGVPVYFRADESAEDFATKLESLPTVGQVNVTRSTIQNPITQGFWGYSWNVTFVTSPGDLPMMTIDTTPFLDLPLTGAKLQINVVEVSKGVPLSQVATIGGLVPGQLYTAQIVASNSIGDGDSTTTVQNDGLGVVPMSFALYGAPSAPTIHSAVALSANELLLQLAPPTDAGGGVIEKYLIEYSTNATSAFGVSVQTTSFRIYNTKPANDTEGYWRIGFEGLHSALLPWGATAQQVAEALSDFPYLTNVHVNASVLPGHFGQGYEYDITTSEEIGALVSSNFSANKLFDVDISSLSSESLTANIRVQFFERTPVTQIMPTDYAIQWVYRDCSKLRVGGYSEHQVLTIASATADVYGTGSFRLSLGGYTTPCLPVSLSTDALQAALTQLPNVENVFVEEHKRNTGSSTTSYRDLHVFFAGVGAQLQWPYLRVVPVTGSSWGDIAQQSCAAFSLPTTTVAVSSVSDTIACSEGVSETQAIILESKGPVTGYFSLYLNGTRTVSISANALAAEVESALNSLPGFSGISVTRYFHVDSPFVGYAWVVTFPESYGNVESLMVDDKYLNGTNVGLNIYPLVNISMTADNADMTGHFQIVIGDEATMPLSWSASDAVVLNALHNLTEVGKVAMIGFRGDEQNVSVAYVVTASLQPDMTTNSLTFNINATTNFAVGDSVYFDGDFVGYIATMTVTTSNRTLVTLSGFFLPPSTSFGVTVGPMRSSKVALPGYATILPLGYLINATFGNVSIVTQSPFSSHFIVINGSQYNISSSGMCVGGFTINFCVTLLNPYMGASLAPGVGAPIEFFGSSAEVITTTSWLGLVAFNDPIWIGDDEMRIVWVNATSVKVDGMTVAASCEGTTAFTKGNGFERAIVFKAATGSIDSVRVTLESNFRATNAVVNVKRSEGILPGVVALGALSEVQTVTFRAPSQTVSRMATNSMNSTFQIVVGNAIAGDLSYASSAAEWKQALESLLFVDRVTVVRTGDGASPICWYGYSYTITFWGQYGTEGLPQITVNMLNVTKYGIEVQVDTVRQGGIAADFTSRYVHLQEAVPYAIRARAFNQQGVSAPSKVVIAQTEEVAALPGPVESAVLGAYGNASTLSLSFRPPQQNGGALITTYLIESDTTGTFNPNGSTYLSTELSTVAEIQEIMTTFGKGDDVKKRGGTFNVTFGCRTSPPLPFDIAAHDMATALNNLLGTQNVAIPPVEVSRITWNLGYKWLITFRGIPGNVGLLQVDPGFLIGEDPQMHVAEIVAGSADVIPGGYSYEVQTIRVQSLSPVSGWFVLGMAGYETPPIYIQESYISFKQKLESLPTIFTVKVKRDILSTPMNLFCWTVTFTHTKREVVQGAGQLPPLTVVSTSSLMPNTSAVVEVFEVVKGTHPLQVNLANLTTGSTVHTRITSYNDRGFSRVPVFTSSLVMGQPPALGGVVMSVASSSAINVSWASGGTQLSSSIVYSTASLVNVTNSSGVDYLIDHYLIEMYTSDPVYEIQVITTSSGTLLSEIQRITIDSDANNLGGYFKLEFNGEMTENIYWSANAEGEASVAQALASLSTCGPVSVTRQPSTRAVDGLKVNGTQWSSFVNVTEGSTASLAIGDVVMISGQALTITSVGPSTIDFEPETLHFATLSEVSVYKWSYGYLWDVTFTAQIGDIPQLVPFASHAFSGSNPVLKVTTMVHGVAPLSGTFRLGYAGSMSRPIDHDASSDDLKSALEELDTIAQVAVTRLRNGYGFDWIVTFLSELGDLDLMYANDAALSGPFARAEVSVSQHGVLPQNYTRFTVIEKSIMNTTIQNLIMGQNYQIRISSHNFKGFSYPVVSNPVYLSPKRASSPPINSTIFALSPSKLKFVWHAPLDDGGSPVTHYRVEWDVTPSFTHSISRVVLANTSGPVYCFDIDILSSSSQVGRFARVFASNGFKWSSAGYPSPRFAIGVVGEPGPPISVIARPTSSYGIMASWLPPADFECVYGGDGGLPITFYVLEWDSRPDFGTPASKVFLYGQKNTSYDIGGRNILTGVVDTVLSPNVSYYLRVTAFNGEGSSTAAYVPNNPVKTIDQLPSPPRSVNVTTFNATALNIQWTHGVRDGGATLEKYRMQYSSDSSFGSYGIVDFPIVPEVQTIVAEAPVVVDTQAIRILAAVTNEK